MTGKGSSRTTAGKRRNTTNIGRCRASSRAGWRTFGRTQALQAELTLAPDYEQTGGGDDRGADEDVDRRQLVEEEVANQERKEHRGVIERRHHGGRCPA